MKMKIKHYCEICGNNEENLFGHIKSTHNMSAKDYYDKFKKKEGEGKCGYCQKEVPFISIEKGYQQFCNKSCRINYFYKHNSEMLTQKCPVCDKEFTHTSSVTLSRTVAQHLRNEHNTSFQEVYDKTKKKEGEGLCLCCGKPTRFKNFNDGYVKYCSNVCQRKFQKYGEEIRQEEEDKAKEKVEALKEQIQQNVEQYEDDKATWLFKETDLTKVEVHPTEETFINVSNTTTIDEGYRADSFNKTENVSNRKMSATYNPYKELYDDSQLGVDNQWC